MNEDKQNDFERIKAMFDKIGKIYKVSYLNYCNCVIIRVDDVEFCFDIKTYKMEDFDNDRYEGY